MRKAFETIKILGLKTGAEIGTHFGCNAVNVLTEIDGVRMFLVDDNRFNVAHIANAVLSSFITRGQAGIILENSQTASLKFHTGQLDFVYIDADHEYPSVVNDINLWKDKVKVGGVLCGHDYNLPGVNQAVNEYAQANKYIVNSGVNINDDNNQDWWILK